MKKDTVHLEENKEKLSTELMHHKRKSVTKNNTNDEINHNKRSKVCRDVSHVEDECENFEEECRFPRELDQSEMEKLVQKIREKICFSTCIGGDKNRHRVHVCVICDCLIIGLEPVKYVDKETLPQHSEKLCVSRYEEYYDGIPLNSELVRQYQVDDFDLKHLLLSPRARLCDEGYECCESCFCSLKSSKKALKNNLMSIRFLSPVCRYF